MEELLEQVSAEYRKSTAKQEDLLQKVSDLHELLKDTSKSVAEHERLQKDLQMYQRESHRQAGISEGLFDAREIILDRLLNKETIKGV